MSRPEQLTYSPDHRMGIMSRTPDRDVPPPGPAYPSPRRGRLRRAGLLTLVLLSLALGLAACGGSSSSGPTTSTSTTIKLPPVKVAPEITTPTTTISGKSYTVPTEQPNEAVDPGTATGGQIIVTSKGVLPQHLFANLNQVITWTNLTSKPITVKFLYSVPAIRSGEIPTGGTWTYSSKTLYNFVFVTSNDLRGEVSIGEFS